MLNPRRIARELALKALFQIDIGKQPRAEVLEGALEQVRAMVNSPVGQITRNASSALQALAQQSRDRLTTQGRRQMRQAMDAAVSKMQALADAAAQQTHAVIAETPAQNLPAAEETLRLELQRTQEDLQHLSAREGLLPDVSSALNDLSGKRVPQIAATFHKHLGTAAQIGAFLVTLVHGVTDHQKEIDSRLAALSSGWSLDRQAAVDRNIMRLAAFEMLYLPDIPTGASINEAVELAKKYSTAESSRFVNGVLGALAGQKVKE